MNNYQKINLLGLNKQDIFKITKENHWPAYRADQIYTWVYKGVESIDLMHNLPLTLREELNKKYTVSHLTIIKKIKEKNTNTIKYLLKTEDNLAIEAVLMHYKHGVSLCISSQAGCNMACSFCASAIGGLQRNLTAGEMLSQVYVIQKDSAQRISNIVMMGSGEPLENYENTIDFLKLITDQDGLNISKRSITLSTCGIAEKIYSLADSDTGINLSVSLHNPFQQQREKIMPIAKRIPLDQLLKACFYYVYKTKRRITFEYALIDGINDTLYHAQELIKILKGLNCLVNLIPANDISNKNIKKSSEENIKKFYDILTKNNVNTTIRRTLGSSINAACGQLKAGIYKED
jgi:23S rRNA (adenine2503-C2)-methyltransferase